MANKGQTGMKKIENVFTPRHLIIAKLVAMGYDNRAIINKIYYSIGIVSKALKDFYTRYEILGNNYVKRKKLFLILKAKLKQNT